jgi:hypothetical protein
LSRGEYLAAALSADDRLGQPNALARFVEFLDGHPTVGYVMSNIMTFETGKPAAPSAYHYQVKHDRVIPRREWLTRMAVSCYLLFSITRKECYEKYGRFPEDMRVNFDWQLGCLHAFHYDVGIIAEPLFHYRIHQQALSQGFGTPIDEVIRLDVLVRLRMRQKALELGENEVARAFEHEMVAAAARRAALQIGENSPRGFSVEQFEEVLKAHFDGQELPHGLVEKVQRAVPTALEASAEYWHGQGNAAEMGRYYKLALKEGGWNSRVAAKATLARMGKPGQWLRALLGRPRVEQK